MKKILLIIPYASVGGMERLAFTFYEHYKSQGHVVKAVKIVGLENDIFHFGPDEYVLSRKDFHEMPGKQRALFYLRAPLALRKIIKKEKITHSIAFGDMANMFSSLSFSGEFKIASIHALKSVEFTSRTFLNKVFKWGFKTTYSRFDKVVCISEDIRRDLLENCGFAFPEKLGVIYNPHNWDAIKQLSGEALDADSEASLFTAKTVFFLGRMSGQKSPWHLVNAFSELLKTHPDANLVVVGDGDPVVENYVREQCERLGLTPKVTFLGRRQNPYRYLVRASVLALSSLYEGTPNVIVEAIALGIPVVSSNCTGGIGELMALSEPVADGELLLCEAGIITPNFFSGTLALPQPGPVNHLEKVFAGALDRVLSDKAFAENLRESQAALMSKFDLGNVARAYLEPLNPRL